MNSFSNFVVEKEKNNNLNPKSRKGIKKMENGISTRLRNLMNQYIGKTFAFTCYGEQWTFEVGDIMECGYFVGRLNDGNSTWLSNMSYPELRKGIKKGTYREIA